MLGAFFPPCKIVSFESRNFKQPLFPCLSNTSYRIGHTCSADAAEISPGLNPLKKGRDSYDLRKEIIYQW